MSIFLLVMGLLLFVGLVVVHEYGHFIAARRNNIDVEEFGIGFPPRAKVITKKNGTEYTLNWLPIGGFVRLKGEHDADTEPGTFGAAPLLAKVKVMVAGVAMNLAAAFVIFTLLAVIGMPVLIENQYTVTRDTKIVKQAKNKDLVTVAALGENSPAAQAGISEGDRIISISGAKILKEADVSGISAMHAGQTVPVVYEHNGEVKTVDVKLNGSSPYIGIAPQSNKEGFDIQRSTWSAPIVSAGLIGQLSVLTFKGLGNAASSFGKGLVKIISPSSTTRVDGRQDLNKAQENVSGPVGIFFILKTVSREGVALVLFLIGIISLTLAIMNLLPIPALDGGRLFVTLWYRLIRRPLTQRKEELIHGTGFALLMVLFVLITIVDVKRFF